MKKAESKKELVFMCNQTTIDPDTDGQVQISLAKHELINSIVGQLVGSLCMIVGSLLALSGAVGNTTFLINTFGLEASLTDAGPGVVLFVVGYLVIRVTRYRFSHHKKTRKK